MSADPKRWPVEKTIDLIARVTPRCHDITRLLSQSMDQRLPLVTRLSIRLHFVICIWCKRYAQQLAIIRKLSRSIPEDLKGIPTAPLPQGARKRIRDAVKRVSRS
jgi:hypothetical protein